MSNTKAKMLREWDIESAEIEALELKEHALDYIDTYQDDEIANLVREGIITIEEVEAGLRRKIIA